MQMLGLGMLDTAIALVMLFGLISLVCTAAKEWLEGVLKARAVMLDAGIREMLNDPADPTKTDFAAQLYQHPLIFSLFRGDYGKAQRNLPSYIPTASFVTALLDMLTPKPAAAAPAKSGDRVYASPLAKRLAANAGMDLKGVQGSGPNGRIVKTDVEQAIAHGPRPSAKAAAPQAAAGTLGAFKAVPHTSMRKIIAKRLQESKSTVPHFYLTVDYVIDDLLKLRKDVNEKGGYKISVNDFVIKACAIALRKMPHVNASWSDEATHVYDDVDISVAVATPDGLITPIIRKADQKSLSAISAEMKDLAQRAKDKKLKLEEFQGGGFSISNLGMFGVKDFAAIINPPQSCILAVGKGDQRPIVKNGALAIANVMSVTLSVDHRVVDGAVGAEFLQALGGLLENPLTMLV